MPSNIPDKDYSSIDIANHFIHCSPCTNMKLQKLVYISYGFCLATYNKPLVADEHPEVWKYGPVFPKLYQKAKGRSLIGEQLSGGQRPKDVRTGLFLDIMWEKYGSQYAWALGDLTHEEGTPWDITRKKHTNKDNSIPADLVIPNDVIKEHYLTISL